MKSTRAAVALVVVLGLAGAAPPADGGTVCNATPIEIPWGFVTIPVVVTGGGWIQDVRVYLGVDHPRVGDLDVVLRRLFGGDLHDTEVFLRPGLNTNPPLGCTGDDVNAFFRDDAIAPAEESCSEATGLTMGPFGPTEPFSAFFGQPVDGTWRLLVGDAEPDAQGQYLTWCLIWDALDLVFADGFESGNTAAWSSVVP
jgi:hypothetical protein